MKGFGVNITVELGLAHALTIMKSLCPHFPDEIAEALVKHVPLGSEKVKLTVNSANLNLELPGLMPLSETDQPTLEFPV